MSLVELALKKIKQDAQGGARAEHPQAAGGNAVFGTVVPARAPSGGENAHRPPERVVEVNLAALRSSGLLPPEQQERQLAQQYRQIKRPLVDNALGRGVPRLANGNFIMVASAVPGEGKTFSSINLAFSIALEKDVSVLLVDADVAKPHISRLFGLEKEPGLLNLLQDETLDVESLIFRTNVPGVSVLPAGRATEYATELMASARMRYVAQTIARSEPSRITLFDSPPLLLTTESHALANLAGQIVVVVRADVTPQQVVLDALSYLGEGKVIGLVLNQSVATAPSGYYYYGYGFNDSRES